MNNNPLESYRSDKKIYIEVQHLYPKDVFGLVHLVFGGIEGSTSVTLISEGAECILINKAFFLKHLNDEVRKKLRESVSLRLFELIEVIRFNFK
jgi:hypothetical protein